MRTRMESNRIWVTDDNGELLAEITYPDINEPNVVNINHTFVSPALRGQGMADKLMTAVVEQIRKTKRRCRASCSYAAAWMQRHPEWADIWEP